MYRVTFTTPTKGHELRELLPMLEKEFAGQAEFVLQEPSVGSLPFKLEIVRLHSDEVEPIAALQEYRGLVASSSFVCGILRG